LSKEQDENLMIVAAVEGYSLLGLLERQCASPMPAILDR
jgi:hypothetical protein